MRLFCVLVPFGLVRPLGGASVPFGVLVSWVFYTLESTGATSDDPFEGAINDVPIAALRRVVERDARHALGVAALPPPATPVDGVLL